MKTGKQLLLALFLFVLVACAAGNNATEDDPATRDAASVESADNDVLVAYEIAHIVSPSEIVVWRNLDMSQAEFEALDLPLRWRKNEPREIVTDGGQIFKSPGAENDGEFVEEDLFGHTWEHVTTVIDPRVNLDAQGLLSGSVVYKHHQMIVDAGRTVFVLESPEGEHYIRNTRDYGRTSDTFAVPDGWQLIEHVLTEPLVIQLPVETLVIRTENEDSFQGPITELQDQVNADLRPRFEIIEPEFAARVAS